jgi:hypothetical protein
MSKIPQGEWNAIAARYQSGESISQIARSYGCTPPAIHYILKRNRQRPPVMPARSEPLPLEAASAQLVRAKPLEPPPPAVRTNHHLAPAIVVHSRPAAPLEGVRAPAEQQAPPPPAAAQLPGLDSALHLRAEAAIEMFRSSFDAALSEGSPVLCERLRRAASDLMRVAARTTIVLDQLSAIAERSARQQDYPRSANAGDEFTKRR